MQAPLALCLVEDPTARDNACDLLAAAGFDVLSFDDCWHASAWLEEETPMIAVVSIPSSENCSWIARELSARDVPVMTLPRSFAATTVSRSVRASDRQLCETDL